MNQKEKLIELLEEENAFSRYMTDDERRERLADYLLANGVIVLPCKPLPCEKDGNPMNSDVYCPYCGTNISGCYPNCELDIVPCVECGTLIDTTKSVTREEAETALTERNEDV